jgi:hypothetical protein
LGILIIEVEAQVSVWRNNSIRMIRFDFDLSGFSYKPFLISISDNIGSLPEIGLVGDNLDSSFGDGSNFNLT